MGATGDRGKGATVTVGNVTKGAEAAVTNSGTDTDAVLNFVLPQGDTGPTGQTGPTGLGGPTGPTGGPPVMNSVVSASGIVALADGAITTWPQSTASKSVTFPAAKSGFCRDFAACAHVTTSGLETLTLVLPDGVTVKSYVSDPLVVVNPINGGYYVWAFTEISANIFVVTRKDMIYGV